MDFGFDIWPEAAASDAVGGAHDRQRFRSVGKFSNLRGRAAISCDHVRGIERLPREEGCHVEIG
jgi:hypothetical protein